MYGGILLTKGSLTRRTAALLLPLLPNSTVPDGKFSSWTWRYSLSTTPFDTSDPINLQRGLPILTDSMFSGTGRADELLVAASAAAAESKSPNVWPFRFSIFSLSFAYWNQIWHLSSISFREFTQKRRNWRDLLRWRPIWPPGFASLAETASMKGLKSPASPALHPTSAIPKKRIKRRSSIRFFSNIDTEDMAVSVTKITDGVYFRWDQFEVVDEQSTAIWFNGKYKIRT